MLSKFSDARRFGRTATGLLLIAGPALLVIASIVSPNTDHDSKLRELAAIAAHKGTYLVSGLMFLLGSFVILFAGVGVIRMFRGRRGVALGQVGGVGLILAGAVGAGWYALGAMEYEMVHVKGLNRAALAQFLHAANSAGVVIPLIVLFMVGAVVGVLLLGIAAWRTQVVPRWAAAVIVIAGPINFIGQSHVGSIITDTVLLAALGALGVRALSMSDEEWEAPRERSAAVGRPLQAESSVATA